jgi:L-rhamnose mutarotase
MQRKIYLTQLRPEGKQAYIDCHKAVPDALMALYKKHGMKHVSVHLLGDTIVLVMEGDDIDALQRAVADEPDNIAWQEYVRPMKGDHDWIEMEPIFYRDLD